MATNPELDQPGNATDKNTAVAEKKSIYPQVNTRLVTAAFWFGVLFIVMAFFMQNVSGYF